MKKIFFKENSSVYRTENLERFCVEMRRVTRVTNSSNSEEEFSSLLAEAQAGSIASRNKLVEKNLRLAYSVAAHYNGMTEFEDLLQTASIGLIKAIENYRSTDGLFSSYAVMIMRREIMHELTANGRKFGHEVRSIDEPLEGTEGAGNERFSDLCAGTSHADDIISADERTREIKKYISFLTEPEAKVILGEFLQDETDFTMSLKLCVCVERIQQIKRSGLKKLRELM